MKFKHLIYFLIIFCTACRTTKPDQSVNLLDGRYTYKQKSKPITIKLYGDYKFKPLNTTNFRDIDKDFIRYTGLKLGAKPAMLYSAYTYVQPYYSTICIQYKDVKLDSSLFDVVKKQLKKKVNSSYQKYETLKLDSKNVHKIAYEVTNKINGVATLNYEYFFENDNYLYRLFFWTTDSNEKIMTTEAESIISKIQFE